MPDDSVSDDATTGSTDDGVEAAQARSIFSIEQQQAETIYQAGTQHFHVDELHIQEVPLARAWLMPQLPPPMKDLIERRADVAALTRKLRRRRRVAITSNALAVQGMPGVGKTVLAQLFALGTREAYPGGVLWEVLGPEVRRADQADAILNAWASHAFGGQRKQGYQFAPAAVRALLAGHGRLLVVLDDVWSLDVLMPLRAALPDDAHLVLTTRSQRVADELQGAVHNLDVLQKGEAFSLIRLRLQDRRLTRADQDWMGLLAESVGRHALALDIAVGSLLRRGPAEWPEAARRIAAEIRAGRGFGELPLKEGERTHTVEYALWWSYRELDPLEQERFRLLGALAPEAQFTTPLVAALWQCAVDEARDQLTLFVEAALLARVPDVPGTWRQHSILRAYALALLRHAGEAEAAGHRHAVIYSGAMREADKAQRHYEMLAAVPQLQHAFAWAVENDLQLALALIGNCANLQAAFGMARENHRWCEEALEAAHRRGDEEDVARAWGELGNALQRVAGLAEEDRGARLRAALAAYQEALRFYRPESAPLGYAGTQNNRGIVLRELAGLAEEDRGARLREALAAYQEALRFYRPESAPLDYAMTQNNRGTVLRDLAGLAEEDRGARLREALAAVWAAYVLFEQLQHAPYLQVSRRVLMDVRAACGDDFAALWGALQAGAYPEWLREPPEDTLADRLIAFLNARSLAGRRDLLEEHPALLSGEADAIFEQLFAQYASDEEASAGLRGAQALLQACRERGVGPMFAELEQASAVEQAVEEFGELYRAAAADGEQSVEAWRGVVAAGEGLLALPLNNLPSIDADALHAHVASAYTGLGAALDEAGSKEEALDAFARAVELQPEFATWRRNLAGTLIECGRIEEAEAEAALAEARRLEPEAARLAELDADLAAAREAAREKEEHHDAG